ncbi:hypothetical protein [Chryseobacterium sp. JV274]|uniref:hypothetical protein n=1 Tax=Chryseobacterium sp. JV274 TaxID=1932669 RepID=UPI000985C99F|nr:hypothetical protein [Chryseobacterium sp. JV274]
MQSKEITVEKICKNVFIAKTTLFEGKREMQISMKGHTEEVAREKLQLCIDGKPYKHLDK